MKTLKEIILDQEAFLYGDGLTVKGIARRAEIITGHRPHRRSVQVVLDRMVDTGVLVTRRGRTVSNHAVVLYFAKNSGRSLIDDTWRTVDNIELGIAYSPYGELVCRPDQLGAVHG